MVPELWLLKLKSRGRAYLSRHVFEHFIVCFLAVFQHYGCSASSGTPLHSYFGAVTLWPLWCPRTWVTCASDNWPRPNPLCHLTNQPNTMIYHGKPGMTISNGEQAFLLWNTLEFVVFYHVLLNGTIVFDHGSSWSIVIVHWKFRRG